MFTVYKWTSQHEDNMMYECHFNNYNTIDILVDCYSWERYAAREVYITCNKENKFMLFILVRDQKDKSYIVNFSTIGNSVDFLIIVFLIIFLVEL